ncbi:MAG: hypothetical protein AAFV19_09645 [Pseudomonadota bacterium]
MIHTLSNLFTRRAATAVRGVQALLSAEPDRGATQTPQRKGDRWRDHTTPENAGEQAWDLVADEGALRAEGAGILHLFGAVFDIDGDPIAGAGVEIWQCDLAGSYVHDRDPATRTGPKPFRGFGRVVTGADGSYRFRTILPVAYPGRAPHIHARIIRPGGQERTTEIYLLDAPGNARDWAYQSLGKIGQAASSIDPVSDGGGDLWAGFNVVV